MGLLRHLSTLVLALMLSFGSLLIYSWSVAHGLLLDQFGFGGIKLFLALRVVGDMRQIIDGLEALLWVSFALPYIGLTVVELGSNDAFRSSTWMYWPIGILAMLSIGGLAQGMGIATFAEALMAGCLLFFVASVIQAIRVRRS